MDRWNSKIAVVTGASAGIGAAIAKKLVENGLLVVGLARRQERLDQLKCVLNNKEGQFVGLKCDLSNKDNIEESFKWIADTLGPISLLVNNAGIFYPDKIIQGNYEKWKQIIDTNIYAVAVATSLALKQMQENDLEGHIININSIAGHYVIQGEMQNLYPASKFALTAFTETVRQELNSLKSQVKITSISPGLVATEMFQTEGFLDKPHLGETIDKLPALHSEDVADAVLYVISLPKRVQITELIMRPTGEFV